MDEYRAATPDYRAVIPDFYPVIPAKAGIQRATAAAGEPKTVVNALVRNYNSAVGSFDGRVSVSARRFKELGVSASREIADMKTIDVQVRDSAADLEIPQTSPLALTAADADGD